MSSARLSSGTFVRFPSLLAAIFVAVGGCEQRDSDSEPGAPEAGGPDAGAPVTFTPASHEGQPPDARGRLPGAGDRSIYIPATELFPGAVRVDPGVENPVSGNPQALAAGERHFAAFNCAGCHAPLGGGGMGPPLSDDTWIYGSGPAQIYLSIMHGRPDGMPAWSSMLPQQTAWELVAYVESLSEIDNYAAKKGFDGTGLRSFSDPASTDGEATQPEANRR